MKKELVTPSSSIHSLSDAAHDHAPSGANRAHERGRSLVRDAKRNSRRHETHSLARSPKLDTKQRLTTKFEPAGLVDDAEEETLWTFTNKSPWWTVSSLQN